MRGVSNICLVVVEFLSLYHLVVSLFSHCGSIVIRWVFSVDFGSGSAVYRTLLKDSVLLPQETRASR